MDQNSQTIVLISNSRTTRSTFKILMLSLSSLDNLLKDAYIFQKGVDNFEIEQKT